MRDEEVLQLVAFEGRLAPCDFDVMGQHRQGPRRMRYPPQDPILRSAHKGSKARPRNAQHQKTARRPVGEAEGLRLGDHVASPSPSIALPARLKPR